MDTTHIVFAHGLLFGVGLTLLVLRIVAAFERINDRGGNKA